MAGSASRKQVRTGPAGIWAPSRHASSSAASSATSASSCGVATSRRASVVVRASTYRSATGRRAGVRPRLGGSSEAGSRARAAASASASRALASNGPGSCAAGRPAGRRHRRGQVVGPLRVGAAEHGAPPGGVGLTLVGEHGQHPAARGQVGGEAGHRGQVGQRPARGGRGVVRLRRTRRAPRARPRARRRAPAPASWPATPDRAWPDLRPRRGSGRRSSGEASGPPPSEGSCRVSSSWTALRAASPTASAGPGPAASMSASSAAWHANGCGRGNRTSCDADPETGGRSGSSAHRQSAPCAQIP